MSQKHYSQSSTTLITPFIISPYFCAVFEAQEVRVQREVTGYVGHDVTLPCRFIPRPENDKITQSQWGLKQAEGKEITIVVFNGEFGINVTDSFLKEKVEIAEQSLIIRDADKRDAGLYTCKIVTFPSGSFQGSTNLIVQGKLVLPSLSLIPIYCTNYTRMINSL